MYNESRWKLKETSPPDTELKKKEKSIDLLCKFSQ